MRKISLTIAALVLLVLAACSSGPQATATTAPTLPVATVNAASALTYDEYPATVEGQTEVEIRPQVGGTLDKIFVDEGAYVTAGQPLFKINDRVYMEQLNNASAELLAAEAAAANAQLEINKLTPLVDNKVVSDLQLRTATSNYNITEARVKQAKAHLADARINMGYTLIKAPTAGYIGRLHKKAGSLLEANDAQPLTSLSDISKVHVYFSLSEKEFAGLKTQLPGNTLAEKIKNANEVTFTMAGSETSPLQGRIDMINGGFDKNSGAITLRAAFANANGLLRSGNTGKIKIGFTRDGVISIPQSATTSLQDKIFVFAVGDSSKVHKHAITVAGKSGNDYLVQDGLQSGDRIVLEGVETLQEGMVIKPATAKPVAQLNP